MNFGQFPIQSPIAGQEIAARGWIQSFAEASSILQGNWVRGSVTLKGATPPSECKINATPFGVILQATWPDGASVTAGEYSIEGIRFEFGIGGFKRGTTDYGFSVNASGNLVLPSVPAGSGALVLGLNLAMKERSV